MLEIDARNCSYYSCTDVPKETQQNLISRIESYQEACSGLHSMRQIPKGLSPIGELVTQFKWCFR
jgi:hypothetical protein